MPYFRLIFLIAFLLISSSCGTKKFESPTIYFSNFSNKPIYDLQCRWANGNLLTLPALNPGITRSQVFEIKATDEFFGKIMISWKNSKNERMGRDFILRPKNLPSIANAKSFSFIQFFFDQTNFEVLGSDAPDLSSKSSRMDAILNQFVADFRNPDNSQTNSSLIHITPETQDRVSSWMLNKYD